MTDPQRQLVRRFFDGLTSGAFDADLFTDDVTCWTTASWKMDAAQYRAVPIMRAPNALDTRRGLRCSATDAMRSPLKEKMKT